MENHANRHWFEQKPTQRDGSRRKSGLCRAKNFQTLRRLPRRNKRKESQSATAHSLYLKRQQRKSAEERMNASCKRNVLCAMPPSTFCLIFLLFVGNALVGKGTSSCADDQGNGDEVEIAYILEPFESTFFDSSSNYFNQSSSKMGNKTTTASANWTLTNQDVMFGSHALRIDYVYHSIDSTSTNENGKNEQQNLGNDHDDDNQEMVSWTSLQSRPHSCYGATHFSLWYKKLISEDEKEGQEEEGPSSGDNIHDRATTTTTTTTSSSSHSTINVRISLLTEDESDNVFQECVSSNENTGGGEKERDACILRRLSGSKVRILDFILFFPSSKFDDFDDGSPNNNSDINISHVSNAATEKEQWEEIRVNIEPLISATKEQTNINTTTMSAMETPDGSINLNLQRIWGWEVQLRPVVVPNKETSGSSSAPPTMDETVAPTLTPTTITSTFLIDQWSCIGGGQMISAPFFYGSNNNTTTTSSRSRTFEDATDEGMWKETYFQSFQSEQNTTVMFHDTEQNQGGLQVDYTVEKTADWGGFIDFRFVAPGDAYYNFTTGSTATTNTNVLTLDYEIVQAASIPDQVTFRLNLLDGSNCYVNCDSYNNLERWYSFHDILDGASATSVQAEAGGRQQRTVPLVGSSESSTPFWLTEWAGIEGNRMLDISNIKGFVLEWSKNDELPLGTTVSGSVVVGPLVATKKCDSAVDGTPILLQQRMSYVLEPFDSIHEDWYMLPNNDGLNLSLSSESDSRGGDALFGKSSLRIERTDDRTFSEVQQNEFGWILPQKTENRTHNCAGADYISVWYKVNMTLEEDFTLTSKRVNALRLQLLDDQNGFLAGTISSLPSQDTNNQWFEWRILNFGTLNLSRIQGWKIQVIGSRSNEVIWWLDHLSCVGGGEMVGAAFRMTTQDNTMMSMAEAVNTGTWREEYYRSELSRDLTAAEFYNANGERGVLGIDYTVEQVETWGGFVAFHHLAPGPAYYNLSQATHILLSYDVENVASEPERTTFRFILVDSSDSTPLSSGAVVPLDSERWYSFHSILDTRGPGQLVVPLEGSLQPTTPFWMTEWAGIAGNQQFDTGYIKGFTVEFVLDGALTLGSVVSGSVSLHDLVAADNVDHLLDGGNDFGDSQCVVEHGVHFDVMAPQFEKLESLGFQCCDICKADPECLYAFVVADNGHCYVASYLDPDYISLPITFHEQTSITTMWMDGADKRGKFCDKCNCIEHERKIDCRGRDLKILPKDFDDAMWTPLTLDLSDNPRLTFIGSMPLELSLSEALETIILPKSLRYLSKSSFENLTNLRSVVFEDGSWQEQADEEKLLNVISTPSDSFADVCCGLGHHVPFYGDDDLGMYFCDLKQIDPGIDAAYINYTKYIDASPVAVLTPSSPFMAEAAESVEKCAEFCTINDECRYFSYDARIKQAQHRCYLLENKGSGTETLRSDEDHYADEDQTIPGWISGKPPRTRHEEDAAKVIIDNTNILLDETNGYVASYNISIGATPTRGAVWVTARVASTQSTLSVSLYPPTVVLYDSNQTAKVEITVYGIDGANVSSKTLVIQHEISSCDEAFMASQDANENDIFAVVDVPPRGSVIGVASLPTSTIVVIIVVAVLTIFGLVLAVHLCKRHHHDSIWKVDKDELQFGTPPEIIGRGTFGLVLLAEYRGTQVAVKRVVPAKSKPKRKAGRFGKYDSTPSRSAVSVSFSSDYFDDSSTTHAQRLETFDEEPMNLIADKFAWCFPSRRGSSRANSRKPNRRRLVTDFVSEIRYVTKLRHPCITTVMGAVYGNREEPMLIMEYMENGSLSDLLHNETMMIEGELIVSILRDISQGMRFLHAATPQVIHGDLKAKNILVDRKFRAKVTDFGLSQKKHLGGTGTPFWMAPELLRKETTNTSASDVYSFGILLYEVYSRKDPYEGENAIEVLVQVSDRTVSKRPPVPEKCPPQVQSLMSDCLTDSPDQRPTFEELNTRLKRVNAESMEPGLAPSLKRSSTISLFDIFPRHIAEALQQGRKVEPEHRDVVTIFFADIVGFTNISSNLPPGKVADMLDRLYTKFDDLSRKHDVFKVETIGDCYMAVTNLVKDQQTDHAKRIAEFARDAIEAANLTLVDVDDKSRGTVDIRVGFHSGPVVADVVGTRNPRYCLFGDTVNTASRMETNSKANRIHCSGTAAGFLSEQKADMLIRSRGLITVKGKGEMETFWVNKIDLPEELPPKLSSQCGDGADTPRRRVPLNLMLDPEEEAMLEWASNRRNPELSGTTSQNLVSFGGRDIGAAVAGSSENYITPQNIDDDKNKNNRNHSTQLTEPPSSMFSLSDCEAGKSTRFKSTDAATGRDADCTTTPQSDIVAPTGLMLSKLDHDFSGGQTAGQSKLRHLPSLTPLPRVIRVETV